MGDVDRIREQRVLARLRAIASELSGYAPAELSETATFLELGFDSLLLAQLATEFQREYGLKVTFRQMFDELPTLRAMAAHVDRLMPAESPISSQLDTNVAARVDVVPDASAAPGPAEQLDQGFGRGVLGSEIETRLPDSDPVPVALPVAGFAVVSGGLPAILAQQLALMSQQLQLLRALKNKGANSAMPVGAAGGATGAVAEVECHVESLATPGSAHAASRTTSIGLSVDAGYIGLPGGLPHVGREVAVLTQCQRDHVDRLAARYNARTIGSKRHAQVNRRHHADPRTAAGFNRLWKEMVYPIVVERSSGSTMRDIDGNRYIDLVNGFGLNFIGQSPPVVSEALKAQFDRGIAVGPQTPLEAEAAMLFCELTGMDRVSWVNAGSEAVQTAIRLSRMHTGRSRAVVFSGDHHGNFDEMPVPVMKTAPGVPFRPAEDVLVLDYGSDESLEIIRQHAGEIAAVLVEPVQSRRPDFQPREFLHKLRELTTREGIVLVFDEVVTGFRICPGGAQEYFGVQADLATYGELTGGGMQVGAVAGRSRLMDMLDGGQWQYGDDSCPSAGVTLLAGTFVRYPLAIAAMHATLQYLKEQGPSLQEAVNRRTARLCGELNTFCQERGVGIHIAHFASQMFISVQEGSGLEPLLFYHLRDRGIHVLEDSPCYLTASHTDGDIDEIIAAFRDSVLEMQADGVLPRPECNEIAQSPWRRTLPLTIGQREIWVASQMDDLANCAFNESDSIVIRGPLDAGRFADAVTGVVGGQECFRYRFDSDGMSQWVDAQATFQLPLIDLSELDEASRSARMNQLTEQEALTPFDLQNGPLVRMSLVKAGPVSHVLVINCHHIVYDGFSAEIIMRKIGEAYALASDPGAATTAATVPYSVYIHRTDPRCSDDVAAPPIDYWREAFANDVPAPHDLPTDRPRGAKRSYRGATVHRELDGELSRNLRNAAKSINTSVYALLLSSFQALVSRLSNQEDIVIGVPLAGQALLDMQTVGCCVNAVPLRAAAGYDKPFPELVRETQRNLLDAFEHQQASLGEIVQALQLPRDPSRLPLAELLFNYSNSLSAMKLEGCTVSTYENPRRAIYFDMFMHIHGTEGYLVIDWDYCSDLFDASTMERWADHYIELLKGVVQDSQQTIGELPLMSSEEIANVSAMWGRS